MTVTTQAVEMKLVVTAQRFSDESLLGYLVRLSDANGHSPRTIVNLLEQQTGLNVRGPAEVIADLKLIEALEVLSDAPPSSLTTWAWHALDSAAGPYFNVRGASIPADALMTDHGQVCPLCLTEAGYIREDWELSGMTVCPGHAMVLVDRCPSCQKFLQVLRSPLLTCSHCQFDLRQAPTYQAMRQEILLAEYFAALAPYRLKQGAVEKIDYAESLFALGQTMSFSTRAVLDKDWKHKHFQCLSVEDRCAALRPVALALGGHAIDALLLHKTLLSHVAHRLPYLPRELALKPLVEFLQANQFLSPTARTLLSHGDEDVSKPTAAEHFGGRPPQFHQEAEVIAFLGCTENAWSWLRKLGHIHLPMEEEGFDADEILAAQRRLEGFVSLADMDKRFGVASLTRCLIDWHVLPMATSPKDSWTAVDLAVVGQILDRLRLLSSSDLAPENQGWVRVCDSPMARVDLAEAYSTVIARALRADVVGLQWSAPYALQDLRVSPTDVERLEIPNPSRPTVSLDNQQD